VSGTEGTPAARGGKDVNRPRPTGRSHSGARFHPAARVGPAAAHLYLVMPR